MKLRFITISLFIVGCCTTSKPVIQPKITELEKIDTNRLLNPYFIRSISLVDSTYIIKVSRNDSLFKIVSYLAEPLFLPPWLKKERPPCEHLQEGKFYELEIHSLFAIPVKKNSDTVVFNYTYFLTQRRGAILINGSTITFDEDSHYDIYYTKNLKGLCYIRKDSLIAK
jgi:hypothetical protein